MILRLQLRREPSTDVCTIGSLWYAQDDGEWSRLCWTLEDVVREVPGFPVSSWKIHGQTAIPVGTYPVGLTHSPRFGKVLPAILSVPGFEGVRFHGGNDADDTEGCILVARNHPTEDTIQGNCVRELIDLIAKGAVGCTLEIISPKD